VLHGAHVTSWHRKERPCIPMTYGACNQGDDAYHMAAYLGDEETIVVEAVGCGHASDEVQNIVGKVRLCEHSPDPECSLHLILRRWSICYWLSRPSAKL
jgi:hypothetical protein